MTNEERNNLKSKIINSSGGKVSKSDIERAEKGDLSALLSSLNEKDRQALTNALNNKALAQKILKSPEAQSIINSLNKGKQNG